MSLRHKCSEIKHNDNELSYLCGHKNVDELNLVVITHKAVFSDVYVDRLILFVSIQIYKFDKICVQIYLGQ